MSKDDTQFAMECQLSGMTLLQGGPRTAHRIVTRQLSGAMAHALEEKIGELYEVTNGRLHAIEPAYAYSRYEYHDSIVYGVELFIMSKAELKAHVDAATKELKVTHAMEVGGLNAQFHLKIKEEAQRLLKKAHDNSFIAS